MRVKCPACPRTRISHSTDIKENSRTTLLADSSDAITSISTDHLVEKTRESISYNSTTPSRSLHYNMDASMKQTINTLLHNLGKKLHSEIVQTHHLLASLAFTTSFVAVENNSCLKTMETSRLQFQHLYCISSSVKSTQLFRTHWDFFLSHPGLV